MKPGCPNLIERIESALLSYGNDIDNGDNPLECGLDKYVNLDTDAEFIGKEKLIEVKKKGILRKLMGVKIEAKEINITKSIQDKQKNLNANAEKESIQAMQEYGLQVHSIDENGLKIWKDEVKKMEPELRGNIIPAEIYDKVIEVTQ